MPRGGKREGAGRHPTLGFADRLTIGSECEHRQRLEAEAGLQAARDQLFGKSDYDEQIARLHAIPVSERKGFFDTCEGQDHAEEIEFARREMAGIDAHDPSQAPRVFRLRAPRPYGVRNRIEAEVAEWATERYGKRISTRLVKTCWDEFRSFQAVSRVED